jgi:hypothetical protein
MKKNYFEILFEITKKIIFLTKRQVTCEKTKEMSALSVSETPSTLAR